MTDKLAGVSDIAGKSFDYIIIGGGTAGCVLANRLSEDPHVTVAVLEAGKARFEDPLITTPLAWFKQMGNPDYDWAFHLEPQEHAPNVNQIPWPRGKVLGGSSAMNIMAYTKPARQEMDALEALGNPGWNWAAYQKYAKKAEGFRAPTAPELDKDFRDLYNPESVGHDGPLTLSFVPTGTGVDSAFQKSLANNGLSISTDALDGDIVGVWKGISTIDPDSGHRTDSATKYLLPVLGRPNLKVLTDAFVFRVLSEKVGGLVEARGVEFEYEGKVHEITAAKEVIVCAGGIKTPHILELSGIGDHKILEPLGIPIVLDLPEVGTNAQEHVICTAPYLQMKDDKGIISGNMLDDDALKANLRKLHNLSYDWTLIINAFAFAPLRAISDKAQAIIEKKRARFAKEADHYPPGLRKQYELQLQYLESDRDPDVEYMVSAAGPPAPEPDKPYISVVTNLTHPWSRGTIHVASADPKVNPRVDPRYFEDDTDLEVLSEGFKFARKVVMTSPFGDSLQQELMPGPSDDLSTDEKVKEFVSGHIFTTFHTCGTAAMLPRELGGVVDAQLKVYGTKNLRVMDLSVLPVQSAAHPMAIMYGMAEQAADIIKASQRL